MYFGATELILPAHVSVGTDTQPLDFDAVATIIWEVSAELDAAAAAQGYAVPLAPPASGGATQAYGQIVSYAKKGVTARVLGNFFPNLPGKGAGSSSVADFRADYQAALDSIRKGELPLVGAARSTGDEGRELPRSYSIENSFASSGIVPHVTMGQTF